MLNQASSRQRRAVKSRARLALPVACAALGALIACSDTTLPEIIRVLDRPSAISFSCYGKMVMADTGEVVDSSPQPMSSCMGWQAGQRPAGQESLQPTDAPQLLQFILQSTQGSIAVSRYSGGLQVPAFLDPDPTTPGLNSIPVGVLPVDIVTDPTGCHVLTANAGSCDLSILDVQSAVDTKARPMVNRLAISNAAGEPVGAAPRAMVGAPGPAEVGVECPAAPDGLVYIAYPDCNMVAAVSTATGEVVAGIVSRDDSVAPYWEITDGNVGCGGVCGSLATPPGGGGPAATRPSVLRLDADARRLYIGAENLNKLIIVELDEDYLPALVRSVPLEGDVGILSIAVSEPVSYELGSASLFRFAYAVATDGTMRVIDVERQHSYIDQAGNSISAQGAECDTQGDTRYLHDLNLNDAGVRNFLRCMPVGRQQCAPEQQPDVRVCNPPRRTGARSPGIKMPGNALPLDVAFVALDNTTDDTPITPLALKGYFAYVTLSSGSMTIINVDDQRYELESQPAEIALALPHQIRDFGLDRNIRDLTDIADNPDTLDHCQFVQADQSLVARYTPRLESEPASQLGNTTINASKAHLLPSMQRLLCEETGPNPMNLTGPRIRRAFPVPELSIMAPPDVRRQSFLDFLSVPVQEEWNLAWEGPVSRDSGSVVVDGPPVRSGFFEPDAQDTFRDGSAPFCKMGVEPYDILVVGCDPERGNADCVLGEKCLPSAAAVGTGLGLCSPMDSAEQLSMACREYLNTRRRYTIDEVHRDRLVLSERRRVLSTTPLTGCVDAQECNELHALNPIVDLEPSWACEPDPSRDGIDDSDPEATRRRCVMTCDTSAEDPRGGCEAGYVCSKSSGRCVEGVLPPLECVQSAQRYQVRVGDAFALIGSRTGFLHNIVVDEDGACVEAGEPNPLAVGRVPLNPPPCGDGDNPCLTMVEQVESQPIYIDPATCGRPPQGQPQERIVTREAEAIQVRNPVFTFHLVAPHTTGDAACDGDRLGPDAPPATAFPGYRLTFRVVGGYFAGALSMLSSSGNRRLSYPRVIERGPYGDIWILDQGDRSSSIRGQVLWFRPETPTGLLPANYLQ
jgi:hypothetical protein